MKVGQRSAFEAVVKLLSCMSNSNFEAKPFRAELLALSGSVAVSVNCIVAISIWKVCFLAKFLVLHKNAIVMALALFLLIGANSMIRTVLPNFFSRRLCYLN